jgi:vacuolar-type H+-ATPase subunit F/Vma7
MREWINEIRMRSAKPLVMEIPGAEPAPKTLSLRELIESAVGIRLGVEGRS